MSLQELALFLVAILTSVAGQFFLKLGALKLGRVDAENAISHILGILLVPELLAGLCCYGLGAIAYILVLTRVNLSVAAPAFSLLYVFSTLLGYLFFREAMPLSRLIGLGFVMTGVVLIVWKP